MLAVDDDVDEVALERVVLGRTTIHTLPPQHRPLVVAELRRRGIGRNDAARRVGVPFRTVGDWYKRLDAPPPPDGMTPLTLEQRRAVLDVVHGRARLRTLPESHRWIAVHACRAEGLSLRATAPRVGANHATVARYLSDPGAGVKL